MPTSKEREIERNKKIDLLLEKIDLILKHLGLDEEESDEG